MELTYTNRLLDGEAFVLLNDEINLSNSTMIAEEMYWLKSQGYKITLKINSPGGSVLAGWNIIDALTTTKSDTHIIGLAASMAGVVAQFGAKRYANDNAIGMIHPPSGGDNKEFLEMVRSGLKKALTNKSKLSEEDIDKFMADDAGDFFFDANQMLDKGLIDEIVTTNQSVEVGNKSKGELFQIFNSLITDSEMDNEVKNELKAIREEKTELVNKIEGLETQNKSLSSELEAMKAEKEDLQKQVDAANKAKAEALVNQAIKSGKAKEEEKEELIADALNNYELVEKMLNKVEVSSVTVEDLLNVESNKKSFADMNEEEKADLARKNPELYNKLILA